MNHEKNKIKAPKPTVQIKPMDKVHEGMSYPKSKKDKYKHKYKLFFRRVFGIVIWTAYFVLFGVPLAIHIIFEHVAMPRIEKLKLLIEKYFREKCEW